MKVNKLPTQPYKGTSDLLPDDFIVQKYIFDTWRETCLRFGFKEYLTPVLESAEVYRAKSGEVKEELFTLRDRADRELALRPEMTPSVTRMVASVYKGLPKPIKLFSIANFFRNEAPQKGRTREFWQLNADVFGEDSLMADLEVLSLSVEIMLAFGAPSNSFVLYFNNRILIEDLFDKVLGLDEDKKSEVAKIMDKKDKIAAEDFVSMLKKLGLSQEQVEKIGLFLSSNSQNLVSNFPQLADSKGVEQTLTLLTQLKDLGYSDFIEFKSSIVRGFDYYNGMVFEVFDLNPNNRRSLFGGGRYNGLSEIFGMENFPSTGFAPGNVTITEFLKNWNLLPKPENETYYCPLLNDSQMTAVLNTVNTLRRLGIKIDMSLSQKNLTEGLRYANKSGYRYFMLLGQDEIAANSITVKDLKSGEQTTKTLEKFISDIS